jgi:hypothetical protein
LECGHIHLDRDLDEDQRFGLLVARDVCTLLAKRSGAAPQVIPLIDDEHVLVRTLPSVFGRFFERHFGRPPDRLVPESSPLLMAVGLRLLERLRADDPTSIRTRGTNQHLIDTDGTVIELLDLVSDSPSLGCVLFECALLLYRSDPGRFDAIGQKHCDDGESLHESVLSAIEARCPTDVHNRRRERLLAQSSFTNAIAEVVDNVIEGPRTNHLNVLEAYYSGQQRKVRSLIRRLGLPIGLQSLEFNRYTGTVVLNGA